MLLSIDARLSAAPSCPSVFRDVSLYGRVFLHYDVVSVVEPWDLRDVYSKWFRTYGLFDFVDQLVREGETNPDIEIEDGFLCANNLGLVIAELRRFAPRA